jgi:hypothetical protein
MLSRIIYWLIKLELQKACEMRDTLYDGNQEAKHQGGESQTVSAKLAAGLATHFDLPSPFEVHDFSEKGNINQNTFLILAGAADNRKEFLLQQINPKVFAQPRLVMRAMEDCIKAQDAALESGTLQGGEEWEVPTLIATREGGKCFEAAEGPGRGCWRLMKKIGESRTYKSLNEVHDPRKRLRVAEEAARGLALFGSMTSKMNISVLVDPLPGYRNTALYYKQLSSVLKENRTLEEAASFLPENPVVREGTARHFLVHISPNEYRRRRNDPLIEKVLGQAEAQADFAMLLSREMRSGGIRVVAVHGDTKLDNFLFSTRTGCVKALIDLDTVMPHTWLSDWGDMTRSLVNTAGEKQVDSGRVQVDMEVYRAAVLGFLRSASGITAREIGLMPDAVEIMSLELGVRFLADYLRGDSYFSPGPGDPPDINKVRALTQFALFDRLREKRDEVLAVVDEINKRVV